MEERILKLKQQVKELLEWKRENSSQQIPFNPAINTTKLMQDGLLVVTGKHVSGLGTVFNISLELDVGGSTILIPAVLN